MSAAALLTVGGDAAPPAASASMRTPPGRPTNLRLTAAPSSLGVSLAWDPAPGASPDVEYFVEQDNFAFSWYQGTNVTSGVIRPVGWYPGVTHTFAVYAMDPAAPDHPPTTSNKITVTAPGEALP